MTKVAEKMNKFQIAVLSLLGLIACIIFAGIGIMYLTLIRPTSSPGQVSVPATAVQPVDTPTPKPPTATPDMRFTITQNSLGSKSALEKEITTKGWKFKEVETMSDGTRCSIYESSHVVFGLCVVGDELKAIVIKGDEFADFNPVFAIASMYDIRYFGDFNDAVTDVWFDLPVGETTRLDLDTEGVIMTIQKTYDDGYGITYILESHLP
ncbi:MAG TPA: hypothetical protein PKE64_29830 [Anaerolineae bacterium]|nr:hypothetical protein [Anaerolineae bacterium]